MRLIVEEVSFFTNPVKIIGDKSLSKRDFVRVTTPLRLFGANFKTNSGKLPIIIKGTDFPKSIKYVESKGSAQIKSSIIVTWTEITKQARVIV